MNRYPYYSYYPAYYGTRTGLGAVDPARALAAGGMGFIVGGSAALGVNLLNEALIDSVAKGAGAGVATAAASAAASAVGGSGVVSFAVMAATATGVVYLLNSIGRHSAEDVVVPSKKTT
jgi:hypothetical protein